MESLSAEASSFNSDGVVSDALATSAGASSKEDSTVGEAGRVSELKEAGKLRITSSRPCSA